jgi:hypothetical protein
MSTCAIRHCQNFSYLRTVAPEPNLEMMLPLCNEHWRMIGTFEPVKLKYVEVLIPQPITVEVLVNAKIKDMTRRGKYPHCGELDPKTMYKCRLSRDHAGDHHSWAVTSGESHYWPTRSQMAA